MNNYEKIEALRQIAGLKKKQIAELLEITPQTYSQWKNDPPSHGRVRQLALEVKQKVENEFYSKIKEIEALGE